MLGTFLSATGSSWRRILAAALASVAALVIILAALRADERNLTAMSVAVAIVFGAVTSVQNARMQRRDHTIALLSAFSTAEPLAASDAQVARLLATEEFVDGTIDAEVDHHLIHVLDYYEFICGAALRRHIDAATVVALRGGAMAVTYDACQPYIRDRRGRFGPALYASFETFVRDKVRAESSAGAGEG